MSIQKCFAIRQCVCIPQWKQKWIVARFCKYACWRTDFLFTFFVQGTLWLIRFWKSTIKDAAILAWLCIFFQNWFACQEECTSWICCMCYLTIKLIYSCLKIFPQEHNDIFWVCAFIDEHMSVLSYVSCLFNNIMRMTLCAFPQWNNSLQLVTLLLGFLSYVIFKLICYSSVLNNN